jgi:hypothetical protein
METWLVLNHPRDGHDKLGIELSSKSLLSVQGKKTDLQYSSLTWLKRYFVDLLAKLDLKQQRQYKEFRGEKLV